jgi:hypothetical protein
MYIYICILNWKLSHAFGEREKKSQLDPETKEDNQCVYDIDRELSGWTKVQFCQFYWHSSSVPDYS